MAVDFSKSSAEVVDNTIELAKVFQSKVIPIHVLPDDVIQEKVANLLRETAQEKMSETLARIKSEGVEVGEPILTYGVAHNEIVRATNEINANLVLVGSGESSQGEKFKLGTTTERIIQKSERPVYVVKEGGLQNIQTILCPVDFSKTSKRALKNAITMAHRFKAELTILSVCELQSSGWFKSEKEKEMENESRCARHETDFEMFLQDVNLSGLSWVKEVRRGKPAEEILSTISGKMIDLLVMGTVGRSALGRLLMGSVTEKVVREVPCSFITLKSEDFISLQLENNIRDIENHYSTAMQLLKDGFYEEAIGQFKVCLNINLMHVPAYFGMAKVYEKMNMPDKAQQYRDSGREIMDKMWYTKIEEEVRRYRDR